LRLITDSRRPGRVKERSADAAAGAFNHVAATAVDGLAVAVGSSHAMVEHTADLNLMLVCTTSRGSCRSRSCSTAPRASLTSTCPQPSLPASSRVDLATILNVAFTRTVRDRLAAQALTAVLRAHDDVVAPDRDEVADVVDGELGTAGLDGVAEAAASMSVDTRVTFARQSRPRRSVVRRGFSRWPRSAAPLTPVNTAGAGEALLAGWLSVTGDPGRGSPEPSGGAGRRACPPPPSTVARVCGSTSR
jgi:hypothetical protein